MSTLKSQRVQLFDSWIRKIRIKMRSFPERIWELIEIPVKSDLPPFGPTLAISRLKARIRSKKDMIMSHTKTLLLIPLIALVSACGTSGTSADLPSTSAVNSQSQSQTGSSISLSASSSMVAPSGAVQFTASGGTPPYTYMNPSNVGTLTASTGYYVAPAYSTTVTIEAFDSLGQMASASISVSGNSIVTTPTSVPLSMIASSSSITVGSSVALTVSGGTAPYNYSVASGDGTLSVIGSSTSVINAYSSVSSDAGMSVSIGVTDSSNPPQTVYTAINVTSSTTTPTCSTSPVMLLSATYSGTKAITSYYSPYGGNCFFSASPDPFDTVTCTGMTNVPAISAYYYTCSGQMKMYDITVNGINSLGYYAGLPRGECNGFYTSASIPVSAPIGQLQIDARSGSQVTIYGIPSCSFSGLPVMTSN